MLLAAFNKRIVGDYGVDATLTREEVSEMIEQAVEFLTQARSLVSRIDDA